MCGKGNGGEIELDILQNYLTFTGIKKSDNPFFISHIFSSVGLLSAKGDATFLLGCGAEPLFTSFPSCPQH